MPVGRIAGGSASLAWPHSDISFFTFTFILSEPPTPELPVDARAVGGRDEPRGLGAILVAHAVPVVYMRRRSPMSN